MRLEYVGRFSAVSVDGVGRVARGKAVDFPDALGESYLKRHPNEWKKAAPAKASGSGNKKGTGERGKK